MNLAEWADNLYRDALFSSDIGFGMDELSEEAYQRFLKESPDFDLKVVVGDAIRAADTRRRANGRRHLRTRGVASAWLLSPISLRHDIRIQARYMKMEHLKSCTSLKQDNAQKQIDSLGRWMSAVHEPLTTAFMVLGPQATVTDAQEQGLFTVLEDVDNEEN